MWATDCRNEQGKGAESERSCVRNGVIGDARCQREIVRRTVNWTAYPKRKSQSAPGVLGLWLLV